MWSQSLQFRLRSVHSNLIRYVVVSARGVNNYARSNEFESTERDSFEIEVDKLASFVVSRNI